MPKLNMEQTAALIGVSHRTLQRYVSNGTAPAYTTLPGGKHVFEKSDVVAWMIERNNQADDLADLEKRGPLVSKIFYHSKADKTQVKRILGRNPSIPS